MTEEISQTYLERPYTVLLFKALTRIYEKYIEKDPEEALLQALALVVFLPVNICNVLWPLKEAIEKDLDHAYGTKSVDWYSTQLVRNRQARRIAHYHLEPFLRKMISLLDAKGWLERGALKPRFGQKTRLTA